ncbi:hypothetical protein ND748_29600 [Frankia sp. AiPs1]|uniref:hypothetical protein n=1 Tax=Frankia sp. AiPs1 TaxID=573493 RepID=UPI00204456B3|nr:hypothetical protein [Frankia sp. AiPs1]MCM3925815.1 hypothetical protein [Frankia sp. AiPs1]
MLLILLVAAGQVLFMALVFGDPWGDAIADGIVVLLSAPFGWLGGYLHRKAAEGTAAAKARRLRAPAGSGEPSSGDR